MGTPSRPERWMPYHSAMASPPNTTIIDIIEESLSRPLDPDLVADTGDLTLDQLEHLLRVYEVSIETQAPLAVPDDELWPRLHTTFPREGTRSPDFAEASLRRATSQLLYAHGAVCHDELGRILSRAVSPKSSGGRPRWIRFDSDKNELANYFETLLYLRPLVETGLVKVSPRLDRIVNEDRFGYTFESHLHSTEAARWAHEYIASITNVDEISNSTDQAQAQESASTQALDESRQHLLKYTMGRLFRKLSELQEGAPGNLALESAEERALFEWLVETRPFTPPDRSDDAQRATVIASITEPRIGALEPVDLIALHQSDLWESYRLALRHGIGASLLNGVVENPVAAAQAVSDELRPIRDAAQRARRRGRFTEDLHRTRRDVVVGAVVAAGLAPAVGTTGSMIAFGGATARSATSLVWSWVNSGETPTERSATKWFSAFDGPES